MANNDWKLVMDDNYIDDVKTYINAAAGDANRKLDVLIETVKKASAEGCIDGMTAEALRLFSDRLSKMSDVILEYGNECVKLIEKFYDEIEGIDDNLYIER